VGVEVWKVATYTAWTFTHCCIHSVGVIVDILEFQFICAFLVLKFFDIDSKQVHAHFSVTYMYMPKLLGYLIFLPPCSSCSFYEICSVNKIPYIIKIKSKVLAKLSAAHLFH